MLNMWMSQGKEVLCNLKVEIGPWGNVQRTDTVMLMRFEIIVYPAFYFLFLWPVWKPLWR